MLQAQINELRSEFPAADITYVSLVDATDENIASLEALYGRAIDPLADQDILFFDDVHPNAQSHALLASSIIDTINGVVHATNERLPLTAADYRASGSIAVSREVDQMSSRWCDTTYTLNMLASVRWRDRGGVEDPTLRSWPSVTAPAPTTTRPGLDATLSFTTTTRAIISFSCPGSCDDRSYIFQPGDALGNTTYTVSHASALILDRAG